MLKERIMTGIVLVAALIGLVGFAPYWGLSLAVWLVTIGTAAEFFRLGLQARRPYRLVAIVCCAGVAAAQLWAQAYVVPVLLAANFIIASAYLWTSPTLERFAPRWAIAMLGTVYIGLGLPYLALLRPLPQGKILIGLTIAMVAMADTSAFFVGRSLGKHKFAPLVSPNKTWEGFFAALVGSVLTLIIGRMCWWPELPLFAGVLWALSVAAIGAIGDLIESGVKRGQHVKDSGDILPGHGGLYDRLDAYIVTMPVTYYWAQWMFG